ncbi:MAG: hypothetical protein U0441_02205 [Polyangiaceae bacterium]
MRKRSGAPRAGLRRACTCVLAASIALASSSASAQSKGATAASAKATATASEVTGTVLVIDKDDLVFDVGTDAGADGTMTLDLWRPLSLKHPVTGKVITDRFKIGQIQLTQVRPKISLGRVVGTPSRSPSPGDLILFPKPAALVVAPPLAPAKPDNSTYEEPASPTKPASPAKPATSTSPTSPTAPTVPESAPVAPATPADPDALAVTEMFEGLKNQGITQRIAKYDAFLRAHPQSRFFTVIFEEMIAMKRLLAPSAPSAPATPAKTEPVLLNKPAAVIGVPGQPLRVGVEIANTDGAILQYRKTGDVLYAPLPMKEADGHYFAVDIPAAAIGDRELQYFIEAVNEGRTTSVVGAPDSPLTISIERGARETLPPNGRGSFGLLTDYADYNGLKGNDWASQTEATFAVRYKDLGIRAVRMGFGVFRGASGTIDELDKKGLAGRAVGLTYGTLELEIGMHRLFSMAGRVSLGLLDDGIGAGGQVLARIGSDLGTNLLLGGEILGGVGMRSIIELQLNTFERFPIVLRTEVTNQPAGATPTKSQLGDGIATGSSEVAGRGIVQLGYRITPEFVIAVRGSFQGRNINHAGPGVGGFVGYAW